MLYVPALLIIPLLSPTDAHRTPQLNRNVLKRVSPELRDLYTILEVDFHPLSITAKIEPILAALASKPETARLARTPSVRGPWYELAMTAWRLGNPNEPAPRFGRDAFGVRRARR